MIAYLLWLASGAALLFVWLRAINAAVWWSLGYRRFRGTWYSPFEYSALMAMLKEIRAGGRAMWLDEVRALVAWSNGGTSFNQRQRPRSTIKRPIEGVCPQTGDNSTVQFQPVLDAFKTFIEAVGCGCCEASAAARWPRC